MSTQSTQSSSEVSIGENSQEFTGGTEMALPGMTSVIRVDSYRREIPNLAVWTSRAILRHTVYYLYLLNESKLMIQLFVASFPWDWCFFVKIRSPLFMWGCQHERIWIRKSWNMIKNRSGIVHHPPLYEAAIEPVLCITHQHIKALWHPTCCILRLELGFISWNWQAYLVT